MSKILSGKVKKIAPTEVSADRYNFLKLSEAEPDLGVPSSNGYLLASDTSGNRSWVTASGLSAGDILDQLLTVDGTGSGLDADLLDGQHGAYYLDWANTTNKPDPVITVTLNGDVTGTANTTLTDLASGTVTVTTTIAANSVSLGTDTTGNYVADVTGGTGIAITGTADEGWSPTVSLATAYGDTINPYASKTANYVLASPTGVAGTPTFRALVSADIPTLNQNTTGSAATLTTPRDINGISFNGSANITITAANPNALTISTGLSGTSYDGSSAVTIAIDSTVVTLAGAQTLTNKIIAAGDNTISGITNSNLSGTAGITNANLANSLLTIGSTSISLGDTTSTLAGLTTVTSASFVGALTGNVSGNVTGNVTGNVSGSSGSTTGNAATATKLATARTINGVSFDGSANITITAANPNALTIGTGLSGTSYTGSGAVTIAIDSTVATLTGTQTLTNKTITSPIIDGGAVTFSDTTDATSATVAPVEFAGGVGIAKKLFVGAEIGASTSIAFTPIATDPDYQEGRLWYDSESKTFIGHSAHTDFRHLMGEREWVRCRNNSGATILRGQPVYITGVHIPGHPVHGHHPTVELADASNINKKDVIGLAGEDIASGNHGYVVVRGYIADVDTSALTTGQRIHLGSTAGTLTTNAPDYPNYPMDIGVCLTSASDGTGTLYVNIFDHTLEKLRVTEDAYVDGDITIGGNITVLGTQSIVSVNNLAIADSFAYLNSGDIIGAAGTSFTGSGLDDATFLGHYEGTTTTTYSVRIDGVGAGPGGVDTFEWSKDNFSTIIASDIPITATAVALDNNITVDFVSTTGHTLNDSWAGTAAPLNIDTGIFSNRNTGTSGVGYTHMGIFYDVSTEKWTVLDAYAPEPDGTIDLADASTVYGTIKAATFEGDLIGNVTGTISNASTADKWSASRTITLGGDLTGNVSLDGSANVTLTATIASNSVALGTDTTGNYVASMTAGTGISVGTATGEGSTPVITNTGVTSLVAGNAITISGGTGAVTVNHADTSAQASSTNSGRTYIQSIGLDTYGHVTSLSTAIETVTNTDTNTTYDIRSVTTTGGALLRLTAGGSGSGTDDVKFASGTNVTVAYTDANTITISATDTNTDTNTTYSQAAVSTTGGSLLRLSSSTGVNDDVKFASGTNVTVAYTDANTITINSSDAPKATATTLGTIELFSNTVQTVAGNAVTATASRTYGVQLNAADQAVVNVPWTDTTYGLATSTVPGLVELFSDTDQTVAANAVTTTASRTYGIQLNAANQMVVNVPWTNTETESFRTHTVTDTDTGYTWAATGSTVADSATDTLTWVSGSGINIDVDATNDAIRISNTYSYTLPSATTTVLGGIKLEDNTVQTVAANTVTTTASRTYGIQLNSSGQAVVNVPWSDTNTTYGVATATVLGLVELFSNTDQSVAPNAVTATAGRSYGLQLNAANQGVINVPWTDTNTTYSQAAVSTTGGALLRLTAGGSGSGNDDVKFASGTGITVSYTDANTITINASGSSIPTSTNLQINSLGVGTAASGTAGEIRAAGLISSYYSDERLKTNITPITDAINKVMALTGVTYNANEVAGSFGFTDTAEQIGVLAQQTEKVLPQVVKPAPFDTAVDENGNDYSISGDNYKTVQYDKIVPLLIEAIKEQQKLIEELQSRLGK